VVRKNVRHEYRWVAFDTEEREETRTITLAELEAAFQRHGENLRQIDPLRGGPNPEYYYAMGIDPRTDGLPYGIVIDAADTGDWVHFRNLGLAPGDRLTDMDGVAVTGAQQLETLEQGLLADIRAGAQESFSLTVHRGTYLELTMTYSISN